MIKICDFGLSRCVIRDQENELHETATRFQSLKKWFNNKVKIDTQLLKSENGSIMF
jgi:hypothetical protein